MGVVLRKKSKLELFFNTIYSEVAGEEFIDEIDIEHEEFIGDDEDLISEREDMEGLDEEDMEEEDVEEEDMEEENAEEVDTEEEDGGKAEAENSEDEIDFDAETLILSENLDNSLDFDELLAMY
ncbi:hypothetical protein Trydic_g21083 [Trypoxylus dichotomus]